MNRPEPPSLRQNDCVSGSRAYKVTIPAVCAIAVVVCERATPAAPAKRTTMIRKSMINLMACLLCFGRGRALVDWERCKLTFNCVQSSQRIVNIVIKKAKPILGQSLGYDTLFESQSFSRVEIVTHYPRGSQMMSRWN